MHAVQPSMYSRLYLTSLTFVIVFIVASDVTNVRCHLCRFYRYIVTLVVVSLSWLPSYLVLFHLSYYVKHFHATKCCFVYRRRYSYLQWVVSFRYISHDFITLAVYFLTHAGRLNHNVLSTLLFCGHLFGRLRVSSLAHVFSRIAFISHFHMSHTVVFSVVIAADPATVV